MHIDFDSNDWIDEILRNVDISRMNAQQETLLVIHLVKYRLYHEKQKMEYEESFNIGIQEGREEAKQDIAKKMFEQGFAVEQIAEITDISIEKIHQIINESNNK